MGRPSLTSAGHAIVHAAGGPDIGVGHLRRGSAAARALLARGVSTALLFEGPSEVTRRFAIPHMEIHFTRDRAAAISTRGRLASYHPPPTALVTDLINLNREDRQIAHGQGFKPLVHLNDACRSYEADLEIDTNPYMKEPRSRRGRTEIAAGSRFTIVADDVVALRPPSPWTGSTVTSGLATFGGADPAGVTEHFLQQLPPGVNWTVVGGPAVDDARRAVIETLAADAGATVLGPQDTLASAYLAHDVTVTLGGQTVYEAMCLGRPCLAPRWGRLGAHVSRLAAAGLIVELGPLSDAPRVAGEALADPARLRSVARRGWGTIDGRGAARTAQLIAARLDELVPDG